MVRKVKHGIAIDVKVKTDKPAFSVAFDGNHLHLELTSSPIKGEANKEIIKELAKLFGAHVHIISGHTDKDKTILIIDLDLDEVKEKLHKISGK